jgi:hypothetical protein
MGLFHDLPVELAFRVVHFVSEASHEPSHTAKYLESPILASGIDADKAFWISSAIYATSH